MVHVSGSLSRLRPSAGIALGPILFILAILTILAAVIAAGSGGFTANTTNESAKADAETILLYAKNLRDTVMLLTSNGCADTQLNFYTLMLGSYTNNITAPADHSCDVFDPRGGNYVYKPLLPEMFDMSSSAVTARALYGSIFGISGVDVVPGVGTGQPQLIFLVYYIRPDICQQLNILLGHLATPAVSTINGSFFAGTYTATTNLSSSVSGLDQACIASSSNQSTAVYIFYSVLKIR